MSPATNLLDRPSPQADANNLLEVARLDGSHRHQAEFAVELMESDSELLPYPDLDTLTVSAIDAEERDEVTRITSRMLAIQRLLGGTGTVMLIRGSAWGSASDRVSGTKSVVFFGGPPKALHRVLLYCFVTRSWRVMHLSVYLLPLLHTHFRNGISFETPSLCYPLRPLDGQMPTETIARLADKWRSPRSADRVVAIQKLALFLPELYFAVVNQFLCGEAQGMVDAGNRFSIVVPGVHYDQRHLVHLPILREKRLYK